MNPDAYDAAQKRLVEVVRTLAAEKRPELDLWKKEAKKGLARPDFIWHYLLQSFSTMGRSRGWEGLIRNQKNYQRVTYSALAALSTKIRKQQVEQVCRDAKIRMPKKKAEYILRCFDRVHLLGGPEAAKDLLLAEQGRETKIKFLRGFHGIGPKYARNIMMDVYHKDFRNSIALDTRIMGISEALGLLFTSYATHELFYLEVAEKAGLNGWELDRLLYNFQSEVVSLLNISGGPEQL